VSTDDNDNTSGMTTSQPYLIRAIYEWIVDNNLTPYLMVDANKRGTVVPMDYLDELGRIILNISPSATSGLLMTNEEVTFSARFSGQSMSIVVPTYSVRAIYARENGQGMMFDESSDPGQDAAKKPVSLEEVSQQESSSAKSEEPSQKPSLASSQQTASDDEKPDSEAQNNSKNNSKGNSKSNGKKGNGKKGGHLKVVK